MTDQSKFEQMLEYLISEDQEKAKEIFHQLVVEKSRQIYENILNDEFGNEDEFADTDEFGGDAADDSFDDISADDEGNDMGDEMGDDEMGGDDEMEFGYDEENVEMADMKDDIGEIKAMLSQLLGNEESEDEGDEDSDMGSDMGVDYEADEESDEDDEEDDDEELAEEEDDEEELDEDFFREYVEKIGGADYTKFSKGGDDGVNTKSIVAKPNKMGGTAANILSGDEASGEGTKGGLLNPSTSEENFGNVNVPGGNAGKTGFKTKQPGHGAERKGTGDMGDKGSSSPINGLKSRAK